jgi:hypothetical protein
MMSWISSRTIYIHLVVKWRSCYLRAPMIHCGIGLNLIKVGKGFWSTDVSKVKGLIKAILGELICLYVTMKLKYGLLLKDYQGYLFESQLWSRKVSLNNINKMFPLIPFCCMKQLTQNWVVTSKFKITNFL